MKQKPTPFENLEALRNNTYPGRGIFVGMDETGRYLVEGYFLMGRSDKSRNRKFIMEDNGVLRTAPFDLSKIKENEDMSLVLYMAMAETLTRYAVSNGHQTRDALSLDGLASLENKWQYEPDGPNFTPRISAVLEPKVFSPHVAELSLLKKSPFSDFCESYLYKLDVSIPGLGYCITTYDGDGDPLPSFSGDPYLLPLTGDIENITQTIWDSLNKDNRVSLAVKFIGIQVRETVITMRNAREGD